MISYIKSELYRLLRIKGSYLFIAICTLLLLSANVVLAVVNQTEPKFPYASTQFAFGLFYSSYPMIFILCITVVAIVFSNEYSNHTMKNSISYGISRGGIYFGKLISELIYATVAFLIISGLYIGSAYLLLENSGIGHLQLLLKATYVALPQLLCAIAISNCFFFMFDGVGTAISAVVGLVIAFPIMCNFLALKFQFFAELAKMLPWNLLNNLGFDSKTFELIFPYEGSVSYSHYWIYGLLWTVLFTIIGFLEFRKKEIK